MSTESSVIEPPVKSEASPVTTVVTTPSTPASVVLDIESILKSSGNAVAAPAKAESKIPTKEEVKKEPEPKVETKPETKETAPPVTESDKEKNWKAAREKLAAEETARKAAEADLAAAKAELEKARSLGNPEDIQKKLENYETELKETRSRLRQADLSRDPEFQAKYSEPIKARIKTMADIALASGVDPADWQAAARNWNVEQFASWSESMTAGNKMKFIAALTGAEDIHQQQLQELENADKAWEELTKTRQQHQENERKSAISNNEAIAKGLLDELVFKNEGLKDYKDLGPMAETAVMAAARYQMAPQDVFRNIVASQVLATVTVKQNEQIQGLTEQLTEKDKKIAELEKFVSEHAGAVPRGDGRGDQTEAEDKRPIWERVVVKT